MSKYTWTDGESLIPIDEYVSSQTLSANNSLVLVDASIGGITVTLPAASTHKGQIYTIKKIDSSSNTVTIDANSNETIDGEFAIVLRLQFAYLTIICDGDEWFIIGGEYVKMEDLLEDIKTLLTNSQDRQDTALVIQKNLEKYRKDSSTLEIDDEETEQELRDTVVDVVD
ncbi:hypothetical protein LCGC14_2361640 [marine sediment metagenome]|uniref:Uncharacterized protein n=1 Tax=marine sediment metagenome TaxID=412755 RepID=A0A0F9F1B3_9ZZZZ